MNSLEDFMDQLIEPIAASPNRKQAMREEIFTHLQTSMAKDMDSCGAAQRAIARMGDIQTLRLALQESVPLMERKLFTSLVTRLPDETDFRFSLRISLLFCTALLALMLVPVVLGVLVVLIMRGPGEEVVKMLFSVTPFLFIGFGFASAIIFSAFVIDQYMQRAIVARQRTVAVILSVGFIGACSLLWHLMGMALMSQDTWLKVLRDDLYLSTLGIITLSTVTMMIDFRRRWRAAST